MPNNPKKVEPTDCSQRVGNCPLEQRIAKALDCAGIQYATDYEGSVPENLDFYLPAFDVHIEIKGGHSPRISNQMARSKNVIVAQGQKAVNLLARMLETLKEPPDYQQ
jgi:hypothetical protein